MTPAEIRAEISRRVTLLRGALWNRQAEHLARTGRYWQGLATHGTMPADGSEPVADRLAERAHGHTETWASLGGLDSIRMASVQVDTYDGPHGQGYVIIVRVRIGADRWSRHHNVGPETWRERAWSREAPGLPQ